MKREQFLLCTPLTERSSITDKDWYQQNMLCNKAYSTIWYLRFDQKMMLLLILIVIPYSTCSMRYEVKRPWTVRCPLSVQPLRESYESGPSWLLSTRLPTYHTIPSWLRWPGGYLCGVQKQSSKSDRSHRTCSGDLCLFGLGVKSTKTKYDCHVATSSTITRTTMTHQNFSAISGEPTLQHAHCPYGNCACVWFGTNHHLDAKNWFDFYRWGQLESRWYYMIAMINGLRLIAIYYLELDRQTWHGRSERTHLET